MREERNPNGVWMRGGGQAGRGQEGAVRGGVVGGGHTSCAATARRWSAMRPDTGKGGGGGLIRKEGRRWWQWGGVGGARLQPTRKGPAHRPPRHISETMAQKKKKSSNANERRRRGRECCSSRGRSFQVTAIDSLSHPTTEYQTHPPTLVENPTIQVLCESMATA